MAIQWSSTNGKMRVGINIIFSTVTSASTTCDVDVEYWIENFQTYSDNQILTYNDGKDSGDHTLNYTNNHGSGTHKLLTRSYTIAVSYSGGPTDHADAEITGAYDGSNPYKTINYTIPTRPASLPGAPALYITAVTNNSGQVYLGAPASNGSTIDAYQIEIATNTGFSTGYQLANNSNNNFTGLAASTTYYTRARAHNGVGWGPYTGTYSFTTGATVPGAPTGVGNNTVAQTSANITWTAPASNGGSAITGYQIQVAEDSGFLVNTYTVDDPDGTSPFALTTLNPAVSYWVRVRAVNGVGAGAWSSATTLTTLTGTPSITSPAASEVSTKGFPYAIVSTTGIQSTSTITVEVGKSSATASIGITAAGATDLLTRTDGAVHGLVADDTVVFTNVTNAAPLAVATTYYVLASGLTTTAFKLGLSAGGAAIDITGTGAGASIVDKNSAFSSSALTTAAATNLLTRTDGAIHGLLEGDPVFFTAVVNGAPLAVATPYYVIASGLTTTAFKVSATPGGTEVDLTGTGTGTTMIRYHTLTSTPGVASGNNLYTLQDTTKLLNNGSWNVRARVYTSSISYTTPNSPTISYTVSHTPAALLVSPATGTLAKYTASTNFTFSFSDANTADIMSAYQLVIEDNATGTGVYDSGKTVLAGTSNSQSFVRAIALASTVKSQVLRWKVRVWDRDDQVSAYTGYSTLTLVDPPLVTITTPANASSVNNGSPPIAWTFSAPSGGTQASALVEVRDSTTSTLVWSKTITGSALTTTPPVIILQNDKSYTVTVTATDSYGLATTVSNTFSASYSAPGPIAYIADETQADVYGYVDVSWAGASPDSLFASWKVYRRLLADTSHTWVLVYQTTDQNVRHYLDYLVQPGDVYSYSVTQTAFRSGSILESVVGYYVDDLLNVVEETRYVTPDISHYWIIDTQNNQNTIRLENVTSDTSTLEFESETFNIIGRGRHRDYGDELGYTGSLTCQVRGTARTSLFRAQIERLRRNQETYYLRTPFGKLFPVALGDLGWSPIPGTGISEMGEMTIPYEEVF